LRVVHARVQALVCVHISLPPMPSSHGFTHTLTGKNSEES